MTILFKKFGTKRFEAIYEVNEEQSGMRLDQFIQVYMTSLSRQQIKEKIKSCDIKIKGKESKHKPNTKVYEKDQVQLLINRTTHEDEFWNGKKIELEDSFPIIFENDDLVLISKPPYMITHPTGKHLFYCATVYLEERIGRTAHSIHRLDRETTGVLLLGKNPKAAQIYTENFEKNLVKKCYFFLAKASSVYNGETEIEANERIDSATGDLRKRVLMLTFPSDSKEGKHAKTFFKILYKEGEYLAGLAFPQTGRQHQIRTHALAHGFPLIGDKLYLGGYPMFQRFKNHEATEEDYITMQLPRHALHATALNFPFEGERRTFLAPIPEDFKKWIQESLTCDYLELEKKINTNVEEYFSKI